MDKTQILIQLKRVEGKVRAIQKMVEEDHQCVEVLQQIAAVQSVVENVKIELFENHTRGYIKNSIHHGGGEEEMEETIRVVKQFVK